MIFICFSNICIYRSLQFLFQTINYFSDNNQTIVERPNHMFPNNQFLHQLKLNHICVHFSGESLKKSHLTDSCSDIMNMEEGGHTLINSRVPLDYSKVGSWWNKLILFAIHTSLKVILQIGGWISLKQYLEIMFFLKTKHSWKFCTLDSRRPLGIRWDLILIFSIFSLIQANCNSRHNNINMSVETDIWHYYGKAINF